MFPLYDFWLFSKIKEPLQVERWKFPSTRKSWMNNLKCWLLMIFFYVTWTGTWWKRMSFQYYSWHSRFILYVLVSTVSLCMQHTFLELYIWFMVHKFLIICRVVSCWWLSQLWQSIEWWCLCTLNVHIECFNSLSGKR